MGVSPACFTAETTPEQAAHYRAQLDQAMAAAAQWGEHYARSIAASREAAHAAEVAAAAAGTAVVQNLFPAGGVGSGFAAPAGPPVASVVGVATLPVGAPAGVGAAAVGTPLAFGTVAPPQALPFRPELGADDTFDYDSQAEEDLYGPTGAGALYG